MTGASGFLGATLTRRLVSQGHAVRVLVRASSTLDLLGDAAAEVDVVRGDVTDPASIDTAVDGVDGIFHCAARIGFEGRREATRMQAVNVRGTALVMDAARHAGVRRVVHVSSVAALGRPETGSECLDEEAPWTESRLNTTYGRSKYLAELEVQRAVAEGLDAVIVNPSLIFGPGRRDENTMKIVESVRSGRMRRYPTGGTNVVDVEDVAEGMIAAMRSGAAGRRYLLGSENLPWKRILEILAAALGVAAPSRPVSPGLLRALGTVAGVASRVGLVPPGLTRESARVASATTCFDATRARTELGWTPRPFADTASRIAAHLA